MEGDDPFYDVTKKLHNALQGADLAPGQSGWDRFIECNYQNATTLPSGFDVVFLHDPQTASMRQFANGASDHWVWRCHIDTSTPNKEVWARINGMIEGVDAAVFSVPGFVASDISVSDVAIIPPAIDPFVPKNAPMAREKAEAVVAEHGVDLNRPFITQVSRFDPWKDPLGVIECFRQLLERHPDLQLVMAGNFASDDPEGVVIYNQVLDAVKDLDSVRIVTGLTDLVGPFQSLSTVILQKSIREGFGLTVTEAMWKGTPVVAGNVGGIRLQIEPGVGGFLIDSNDEFIEKTDYLLTNEEERSALGEAGQEHVRSNFLLPRLLRDELQVADRLVASSKEHLFATELSAYAAGGD